MKKVIVAVLSILLFVTVGVYADILIVDGDPTKDVSLLAKSKKHIRLIMKGGKVYKNTLAEY